MRNVIDGSRWRIEVLTTGALLAEGVASGTTVNTTINVYPSGDAKNDVLIKLRKGSSAPKYQPYETQNVAITAGFIVYAAQVPDQIA